MMPATTSKPNTECRTVNAESSTTILPLVTSRAVLECGDTSPLLPTLFRKRQRNCRTLKNAEHRISKIHHPVPRTRRRMFTLHYIKRSKLVLRHAFIVMSTGVETSLIVDQRIVRDLIRALSRRSPVSQTSNAVHPPASPHGVFSTALRFGRNERGRTQSLPSSSLTPRPNIERRMPAENQDKRVRRRRCHRRQRRS